MKDEDQEYSSDDSFSYKNTAKRAFEVAKKKILAVKTPVLDSDLSSDSEYDSKKAEVLPTTTKTTTRPKRRCKKNPSRKSKRLKAQRTDSKPQNRKLPDLCPSDDDSLEDSQEFYTATSSAGLTSKPGRNLFMKQCHDISSDETDFDFLSELQPKGTISDSSSEVEILSPPKNVLGKDENELISIKISWKLQNIQKFQLRRHQKFKVLMEHFAKLEGVPLQRVVIYGGKNNSRLIEPFDTPDTVDISVTDVLEGGVLAMGGREEGLGSQRQRGLKEQETVEGSIKVRVQMEGVRSFHVMVDPRQRMQVLRVKVAEQLEVDMGKVKLSLDGEAVDYETTAGKLDLEEGDVLDLQLL